MWISPMEKHRFHSTNNLVHAKNVCQHHSKLFHILTTQVILNCVILKCFDNMQFEFNAPYTFNIQFLNHLPDFLESLPVWKIVWKTAAALGILKTSPRVIHCTDPAHVLNSSQQVTSNHLCGVTRVIEIYLYIPVENFENKVIRNVYCTIGAISVVIMHGTGNFDAFLQWNGQIF